MKNKFLILTVSFILVFVAIGCNGIDPFSEKAKSDPGSNKTLADKGVDTIVPQETTGVPECDEVLDMLAAEANNPDDGFVAKAFKATFLNKIKETIKKSVEENKNSNGSGTKELAKTCTDFKAQLVKYKADEEQKKK